MMHPQSEKKRSGFKVPEMVKSKSSNHWASKQTSLSGRINTRQIREEAAVVGDAMAKNLSYAKR
jgi:hypothetical protein